MTPQEHTHEYLICEARFLDRLAQTHRRLSAEDEPPTLDRVAHRAWEEARDDFAADCESLREDIDTLLKEWEA